MQVFYWESIGFYCLFCGFVFYQQLHVKNFRGASLRFLNVLLGSSAIGMLTGAIYLAYYGWSVRWWAPAPVFIAGSLAVGLIGALVERAVSPFALSMAAFIGWPISAYLMFKAMPGWPIAP